MSTSLASLQKALASLEEALSMEKSKIVRDGTIQRFEYTIELAWRLTKKKLGSPSTAPKVIVREMASQGLINNPEDWFDYIDRRNETSHIYNEEVAERVYAAAAAFAKDCRNLLGKLTSL